MGLASDNDLSLPVFMAYSLVILLYFVILRILLQLLQQVGNRHGVRRSIIDTNIHATMIPRVDNSMDTFDIYSMAVVIAKFGIATVAIAGVIVLLVLKLGVLAAAILVLLAILVLWALNHWLRSRERPGSIKTEIRHYIRKSGSIGSIIMLSILLVALLFVMIWLH